MTDRTPAPPPDRPLPEPARARIRAELLAVAHSRSAGRSVGRGWVVPVLATAAVVLVAALVGWSVRPGGSDPTPVPAGPVTTAAPPTVPPPTTAPTTSGPSATASQVGTGSCGSEVRQVLQGAEEALGAEPFSFWVSGERYAVCYAGPDRTTVTGPMPLAGGADAYDVASLAVETDAGLVSLRLAGGPVPAGDPGFAVAYTFTDGHTEPAVITVDSEGRGWWHLAYTYDAGRGNETRKPPIEVTVTAGGGSTTRGLEWGRDTCAQVNHGC